MEMNSPATSDRPPTYQQVSATSLEQLHKYPAPYNSHIPTAPMIHPVTLKFNTQPVIMNCPYCGHLITTVVEDENGLMVYILCIVIALFGFILGCCLIPFCVSELKDKIHICPKCQRPIGRKTFL